MTIERNKTTGLVDGKQAILDYLGMSKYKIQKFMSAGMPIKIIDGRWLAHKENIEEWLIKYTDPKRNQKTHEHRLEKSFQIIAERYYEKALSLERESLAYIKKQYDSNPMHVRQGRKLGLSADENLRVKIATYKKYENPRDYFELPEGTDGFLESATQFFRDYLTEEKPFVKTLSASQRYGLLSIIYEKFSRVCEKLEKLDIHPQEGKGLHFAALHRLAENISNYSPPQPPKNIIGKIGQEVKTLRSELAMAAEFLDDFPTPDGSILEISRDDWESFVKRFFKVEVLPSPKTVRKYKKAIELTISDYCHLKQQNRWNNIIGGTRPPKPEYQKIEIKLTK